MRINIGVRKKIVLHKAFKVLSIDSRTRLIPILWSQSKCFQRRISAVAVPIWLFQFGILRISNVLKRRQQDQVLGPHRPSPSEPTNLLYLVQIRLDCRPRKHLSEGQTEPIKCSSTISICLKRTDDESDPDEDYQWSKREISIGYVYILSILLEQLLYI